MASQKKIKITCNGNRTLPLEKLENFQGKLKRLPKQNFEKLKRLIDKRGFSFPVFVWDGNKIIDGHQRLSVLKEMIKSGEYYLDDEIPVCDIEAKTEKEAAEKLLELQGQYGKITDNGLTEFIEAYNVDIDNVLKDLDETNTIKKLQLEKKEVATIPVIIADLTESQFKEWEELKKQEKLKGDTKMFLKMMYAYKNGG